MVPARFTPGNQTLFNSLALPGWINAEEDAIRVLACTHLAFPVEAAKGYRLPIHFDEDKVFLGIGITQVCVLRAQAFKCGVSRVLPNAIKVGIYRQHFWIVRFTLKMAGDQPLDLWDIFKWINIWCCHFL